MNVQPSRAPITIDELLLMLEYDPVPLEDVVFEPGGDEVLRHPEVLAFVRATLEPALRGGWIRPDHLYLQRDNVPLENLSVADVLHLVEEGLPLVLSPDVDSLFDLNLWFITTPKGNSRLAELGSPVVGGHGPGEPREATTSERGESRSLEPLDLLRRMGDDGIELVDLAVLAGALEVADRVVIRGFVRGTLAPALAAGLVYATRRGSPQRAGALDALTVDEVLAVAVNELGAIEAPDESDLWFLPTPAGVSLLRGEDGAPAGPG